MKNRSRYFSSAWIRHAAILLVLGFELIPLYMTIQMSVKDNTEFINNPWLPSAPELWKWENWRAAFALLKPSVANSIFVSVMVTACQLVISVCGAYFFARRPMPGANFLWGAFLLLMMMPTVVNIVPLFLLLKTFHLLDTLWALIFVGIAAGQAFNLYILRNFMAELPRELFEAAEIDGASHLGQLRHVVVPMSLPIIGTLAILTFLGSWNDFLLPLVTLRNPENFTVGVKLIYLDGEYVRRWGQLMAAFLLSALPLFLLFFFTMRWFVRGLSTGAVKG